MPQKLIDKMFFLLRKKNVQKYFSLRKFFFIFSSKKKLKLVIIHETLKKCTDWGGLRGQFYKSIESLGLLT